jgi:hypothetical protein
MRGRREIGMNCVSGYGAQWWTSAAADRRVTDSAVQSGVQPDVRARYGVEVLYAGNDDIPLVAETGQPARAWDAVLLVRYPSRRASA